MPARTTLRLLSLPFSVLVVLSLAVPASAKPAAADKELARAADLFGYRAHLARLASGSSDPAAVACQATLSSLLEMADVELSDEDGNWDDGWADLSPGGDLDGDGADDALDHTFLVRYGFDECGEGFEFRAKVSGVRASDGQKLWTADTGDYGFAVPAGDLDGEPGDDVLLFDVTFAEVPGAYAWTITVSGVRGRDGATLWTRAFENVWTYVVAGPTEGYVDLDFAIPLDIADDVDGDGMADLLVARYDILVVEDYATDTFLGGANAVFEFISGGRGGSAASDFVGSAVLGFPDAAVVPDLSGDGLDDLVVLSADQAAEAAGADATLTAYSGRGAPRWRTGVSIPDGFSFLEGAELDGDGAGDVLIQAMEFDFYDFDVSPLELQAFSGADGARRWDARFPPFTLAVPGGDASGDGGEDVLVTPELFFAEEAVIIVGSSEAGGASSPAQTESELPGALVLNGADGTPIWERSLSRTLYSFPVPDVTGDGVVDAVFSRRVKSGGRLVRASTLISGADGHTAWTRLGSGEVWTLGGDINGDGADDLFVSTFSKSEGMRYVSVSGRTGKSLWPRPVRGNRWVWGQFAVDGENGPLVLESGAGPGWSFIYTGARSGDDGSKVWRHKIRFR